MVDIGLNTQQRNLSTFLNMPPDVTYLVLEKMHSWDLLSTRKVCRSLRSAVDRVGLHFNYINLYLIKDEVDITLGLTKIRYTKAANGITNVIHEGHAKLIDGENFVGRALKDFMILLKHAREITIGSNNRDMATTFVEFFKTQKCIHVTEINLQNFLFDEVLTILPCFNAKGLKKIEMDFRYIAPIAQFERITHLGQWKNAEEFRIRCYYTKIASTMIVHFFHFKIFDIQKLDELSVQTAIQIRDDLLRRSTFQNCSLTFEKSKPNPIEIAKVFKPDYAGRNDFIIEFLNGNDIFAISLEDTTFSSPTILFNVKRLKKPFMFDCK